MEIALLPNKISSMLPGVIPTNWLKLQSSAKPSSKALSNYEPCIKAHIINICQETHDTKTYTLGLNRPLSKFHSGNHIAIQATINNKLESRIYTVSSTPYNLSNIKITVKKHTGGTVSSWLFDSAEIGTELGISEANGQFHLPQQTPGKLLFIAAGSGITPIMSMLRYLKNTGNKSEITLLYYVRSKSDIIFKEELLKFTCERQNINILIIPEDTVSSDSTLSGRISHKQIKPFVSSPSDQTVYMCGPQAFMKKAKTLLHKCGIGESKIHIENFQAANNSSAVNVSSKNSHQVRFTKSDQSLSVNESNTILENAEAIGLTPKYACRTGICRTCRCKKTSGTTLNLATGEVSDKADDYILPCVSVAQTAIDIEL